MFCIHLYVFLAEAVQLSDRSKERQI